jgi:hypothetical protein
MMPGTGPSFAVLPDTPFPSSYEIAFQGNTGTPWTTGSNGTVDSDLGVEKGTSPTITAVGMLFQQEFFGGY